MNEQLLKSLKDELNAMEGLLISLEKQHEYLASRDVFKLEAVTTEIEEASRELARCETKRRMVSPKGSMKEYVENLGDKEVSKVFEDITRVVHDLTLQKDSNELLIKQSLGYTNSMLAMMTPQKDPVTYNGYGKVGR